MRIKSYIKKFTAAVLAAVVTSAAGMTAPAVYARDYDNIINEVCQIRDYTLDGLYIEAIHECEYVLYYKDISPADKQLVTTMKNAAEQMYSFYEDYHNSPYFRMKRADYDGNFTVEAFAAVGTGDNAWDYIDTDYSSDVDIWYIDASHRRHLLNTFGCEKELVSTWYQKFYVWEQHAFGSGGTAYIFGVRNGEPYQPSISGKYDGFNDQDGYNAIWHDFSSGYHRYFRSYFRFDDAGGEFYLYKKTLIY